MQTNLYSSHIFENSKESYFSKSLKHKSYTYLSICIFLLSTLVSLPFIYIDITVQSQGIIRPDVEKSELKAPVSGFITRVFKQDKETLKNTETILTINSEKLSSDISDIKKREDLVKVDLADLKLLVDNFPESSKVTSIQSAVYQSQYTQFRNKLNKLWLQENQVKKELKRLKKLQNKNMTSEIAVENKSSDLRQIYSDERILKSDFLTKWQTELEIKQKELTELESRKNQLKFEKQNYEIKAPVGGSIEEINNILPGRYLTAGETICIISPNTELLGEVYVSPKDIGMIKKGSKVNLLIDSFDYNEWGAIQGEVVSISEDFLSIDSKPVFKVTCKLNSKELTLRNGFRGKVKKGMTFQARFFIAERSVLQLLFDNVNDWLNPYDV